MPMQYDAEIIIPPERARPFLLVLNKVEPGFEERLKDTVSPVLIRDCAEGVWEISQTFLPDVTRIVKMFYSNYSINRGQSQPKNPKATYEQLNLFV
jgi:hypothetical protein